MNSGRLISVQSSQITVRKKNVSLQPLFKKAKLPAVKTVIASLKNNKNIEK
jgi:hypothetical protein